VSPHPPEADIRHVEDREPRTHVARVLEQHAAAVVSDAVGLFPFAIEDPASGELARRSGDIVMQLLVAAVRDGEIDSRSAEIAGLRRLARESLLSIAQLFELVYLIERAGLDELALDESFGATSEPWPAIAQLVRRASFDLLASLTERLSQEAGDSMLTDALTTLHTRAVMAAALEKELQRSERFTHPFALILFDVDRMSAINERYGYGVGDRVLERIGIVLRNYFREQDWVSRYAGDRFAVLLPETAEAHAVELANRMRVTVQDRLALQDHMSEQPVALTVSVAVVIATSVDASVRADQVMREAEQAVHRAKHGGRNRVERVEIHVKGTTPPVRDANINQWTSPQVDKGTSD
jgi:diguanylate cyclase (GGDEF)-like protein